MTSVFIAVLLMSATGALLVLCLSFLYPVTKKTLSATWHYRMYMLVALFLLIPIGIVGGSLFANMQSTTNREIPNVPIILNDIMTVQPTVQQPDILPQPAGQTLPQADPIAATPAKPTITIKTFLPFLPLIWLVGVFSFIIWHGIELMRFKKKIVRTSFEIEDRSKLSALENSMAKMGIRGKLRLFSNNIIKTPMLVGLFKTYFILPEVEINDREFQFILKHELTHFKRRDLWVKSLVLVANAIHWFNPAAYRLTKNIDTFCELSCDEQVVSDMNMEERRFYGETILNVLCRVVNQHSGVYATLADSKKGIERRLTHMMNVRKSPKRIVLLSLVAATILCVTGFAAASIINMTNKGPADNTHKTYSFGIIELDIPGEPIHELADKHFYGDDFSNNDQWRGWEGIIDIYRYIDEVHHLEIMIQVTSVTGETAQKYIEPLITNEYDNLIDRLNILEAQSGHFVSHAIETFSLNPTWQLVGESRESGGRVVTVTTNDGTMEVQESYWYLTDGRQMISRGGAKGIHSVNVYVISSDQAGYEEGQKILNTIHATEDDVRQYIRGSTSDGLPVQLVYEFIKDNALDKDAVMSAYRQDEADAARKMAQAYLYAIKNGQDMAGDDNAVKVIDLLFNRETLTVTKPYRVPDTVFSEAYRCDIKGTGPNGEKKVPLFLIFQDNDPRFFSPVSRYGFLSRKTVEVYLSFLAEGDIGALSRWLSVDGGEDYYWNEAQQLIEFYRQYDLSYTEITNFDFVMFEDNGYEFGRFVYRVQDADGAQFEILISYGDGLTMPDFRNVLD